MDPNVMGIQNFTLGGISSEGKLWWFHGRSTGFGTKEKGNSLRLNFQILESVLRQGSQWKSERSGDWNEEPGPFENGFGNQNDSEPPQPKMGIFCLSFGAIGAERSNFETIQTLSPWHSAQIPDPDRKARERCFWMNKTQMGNLLLVLFLGLMAGAVAGVVLDRLFGTNTLSKFLFESPVSFELYIIKVEFQLTPASIVGLVASGYLALKKG